MQKCNFSLLKFKIQIKIKHMDLLTFYLFVIYNGFFICQLLTIEALYPALCQLDTMYNIQVYKILLLPYTYIYIYIYKYIYIYINTYIRMYTYILYIYKYILCIYIYTCIIYIAYIYI